MIVIKISAYISIILYYIILYYIILYTIIICVIISNIMIHDVFNSWSPFDMHFLFYRFSGMDFTKPKITPIVVESIEVILTKSSTKKMVVYGY